MTDDDKTYNWSFREIRELDARFTQNENRVAEAANKLDDVAVDIKELRHEVKHMHKQLDKNSQRLVVPPPANIDWRAIGIAIGSVAATIWALLRG